MNERGINQTTYFAALSASGNRARRLVRLARILAGTFEEYGHPVLDSTFGDGETVSITASHYHLTMRVLTGKDATARYAARDTTSPDQDAWRIELDMIPRDPLYDDRDISELLLAVMLYRMTLLNTPETVEWLAPTTRMTSDDFLAAFHGIKPQKTESKEVKQRRRTLHRFFSVEVSADTQDGEVLAANTAKIDPSYKPKNDAPPDQTGELIVAEHNDIQRLTVWAMTGTVAFLSAPVAIAMTMVNLLRGEDFRFSTHVLSMTALIAMLTTTGSLERLVAHLPL